MKVKQKVVFRFLNFSHWVPPKKPFSNTHESLKEIVQGIIQEIIQEIIQK